MGFFTSAVSSAAKAINSGYTLSTVERFCRELGWPVSERRGNKVTVYLQDPIGHERPIVVNCSQFVILATFSLVTLAEVPAEISGFLLCRNNELVYGKWGVSVEDGEAHFHLGYVMNAEGLNATSFIAICEEMATEAGGFDGRMQRAGLLR